MRFRFATSCVWCAGDDAVEAIHAMEAQAESIDRDEFLALVDEEDITEVEADLGYDREGSEAGGLTMADDWHVGYYRSTFRGMPCAYFTWSAIEFIFTPDGRVEE